MHNRQLPTAERAALALYLPAPRQSAFHGSLAIELCDWHAQSYRSLLAVVPQDGLPRMLGMLGGTLPKRTGSLLPVAPASHAELRRM